MRVDVISIFPEYFAPLDVSLIGKARERGILDIHLHQLRDWAHDVHRTVDDTPYGGGPGMVMKPEPWGEAIDTVLAADPAAQPRIIVPTPSGVPFTQKLAMEYAAEPWLLFTPARYEGIDSRVMAEYGSRMRVDEVSVGDYVLAGGEVAVLVMVEAVGRLLPGVLGNANSAVDDSFAPGAMENLLEGPVYTKPPEWRGHEVPEILLSGHHGKIARWRRDEALRRTARNRLELLAALDPETLDKHDRKLLSELGFPA
ncbi:tRNA (guanosine(37)-N1)-methyltransferase TrmD [Streptosporangium roseum]|uniref:tRNA (guanine-N(1)-)-methyltransferase n=1 Tax=Streptosporangium roseum (strain ATCC 12428 / DSM 43021 / JCM 3005 / KCTC 9067 / NCIMB 10171 / NRRL 2505 / NI 9100) TaxID=479432 RepID=D2ATE3_STRRD|nr:tRNA (guanosine(37)-N1)-methyltransferase TrmD [Streptosporangium roseum]ACZ84819.1 tRNA (guanine-N(1)-)-methyltransferase [Streptosporangium roseum DSM 43021]